MHGVWGWDVGKQEAVVLRESYFTKHPLTGKKVRLIDLKNNIEETDAL